MSSSGIQKKCFISWWKWWHKKKSFFHFDEWKYFPLIFTWHVISPLVSLCLVFVFTRGTMQCSVYSRLLSVSWELRMAATATVTDPNEIAPKTDCWTILPNLTNVKLKWIIQTIGSSLCTENRTLYFTQLRFERLSWVNTTRT